MFCLSDSARLIDKVLGSILFQIIFKYYIKYINISLCDDILYLNC